MKLKLAAAIVAVMSLVLLTVTVGAPSWYPATLLNSTSLPLGQLVNNASACCPFGSLRARVRSVIAALANRGTGDVPDVPVGEGSTLEQESEAVDADSLPSLPFAEIGFLGRYASAFGDSTLFDFGQPLNPAAPGFLSGMHLGTGFGCHGPCSHAQTSPGSGDGTTAITGIGGNNDKTYPDGGGGGPGGGNPGGKGGNGSNGDASEGDGPSNSLGDFADPFAPMLLATEDEHERYDPVPQQIIDGDTTITVVTTNLPHDDDNIFLADIYVQDPGDTVHTTPHLTADPVPEPATLSLLGLGLGIAWRRRKARQSFVAPIG